MKKKGFFFGSSAVTGFSVSSRQLVTTMVKTHADFQPWRPQGLPRCFPIRSDTADGILPLYSEKGEPHLQDYDTVGDCVSGRGAHGDGRHIAEILKVAVFLFHRGKKTGDR